jgi:glutathione S-transferase
MLLYVDSQFASPYAMSVFVCLREKDLPFDVETIDLSAKENHRSAFATTSITRRVPTLVHDGFALSESSAIGEYIDELFPGVALYPADPRYRARARQVQAWLRSDLMPIRNERPTPNGCRVLRRQKTGAIVGRTN